VLSADSTFTAADPGSRTFAGGATLLAPDDRTLIATDTPDGTITGGTILRPAAELPREAIEKRVTARYVRADVAVGLGWVVSSPQQLLAYCRRGARVS
jgi:hypothetical protein